MKRLMKGFRKSILSPNSVTIETYYAQLHDLLGVKGVNRLQI